MRKTATKMLVLGVAALAVLGAGVTIKNSYASESKAEEAKRLNVELSELFEKTRQALEKAGVAHPEKDAEDSNAGALGVQVSVPAKTVSAAPWVAVMLCLIGGTAAVMMAFFKQYQPATRQASVSEMVDEIVSKNQRSGDKKVKGGTKQADEFEDISRAVDEIVAKYQKD